jgi:hypothetical protein
MKRHFVLFLSTVFFASSIHAQETQTEIASEIAKTARFETVYETTFDSIGDWQFADDGWEQKEVKDGSVLSLSKKKSNYKPAVRSPLHLALLKDKSVSNFRLDVRVLSTHKDYGHRDVCLFFGYKSPTEFYYVHLGKVTDDYCNQIFIVNNAARRKISTTTTEGTNWDGDWHDVRIERDADAGTIQVYFDDMAKPVMTATDKTFLEGRIGLGSFDDTADFDSLKLTAPSVEDSSAK